MLYFYKPFSRFLVDQRRDALADDAPAPRRAVDAADQDPAGADFLDRNRGTQFRRDFRSPAQGGTLAFEQFVIVVDDGGVEDGLGEDGHGISWLFCGAMGPRLRGDDGF